MKLKSSVVMFLILSAMLLITLFGSLSFHSTKEGKDKDPDTVIIDDQDRKIPETFLGTFNDEYSIDENIRKLIIDYMDDYYQSIYTLEKVDTSGYFDNEVSAAIADHAIKLQVETRKLHDQDMSLKNAHYDLKVIDYRQEGDTYYVDILEDDYLSFAFLDGIESSAYDIESHFVIRKTESGFMIHDLNKYQGYYSCFYDECSTVEEVEKTYDYFYSQLSRMISYDRDVAKPKAESSPYVAEKTHNREYDRLAAAAYLDQYYHSRNDEWFNYSDVGGNCQNYASQAMYAGGIPMDFYGDEQWKCYTDSSGYDPDVDEDETASGRSRSWVNVGYFYEYARDNNGSGLVAEIGVNLNYAEVGDIIIVGNSTLAHTVMVSKIVDGHILVNSNSIDMKDYPLDAYTYTNLVLIKILGYNQYQ